MKLYSTNEWDPLRAAVVGTVTDFSPGLEAPAHIADSAMLHATEVAMAAYPKWYLDEVEEDLAGLCATLEAAGVTVLRPSWTEAVPRFSTPNWSASGFDIYNVRDIHVVFGNKLVVSAPASRFRQFEAYAFHNLFYSVFFDEGFEWISAPKPRLLGEYVRELARDRTALESMEDELHKEWSHGLSQVYHRLEEDEVIFDAANVIRLDGDVLYLVSSTGNRLGARWLSTVLGHDFKVHLTHTYRSSHLDSTILPLRPGVVLLNGARVSEETCPELFKSWDKIFFTAVEPLPAGEIEFHRRHRLPAHYELKSMGIDSALNHISSPWAGLNVLSIDPQTVLVHDRQTKLAQALGERGFEVVPVQFRHCYTMLGGLHCTTLDVARHA